MPLHPETEDLLDAIRALEAYLIGKDEFWAAKLRSAADEVAKSDAHGLQRFLSFFGGMGSLGDLVLQCDGLPLGAENDQLASLRQFAWSLANALRHEMD